MTAAAFHAGEVEAQNAFNRQVYNAQNTSMFNYNRINGISQDTANAYIANGIIKAAETSMNYGCDTPTLSAEAVATYVVTVQNAKTTANQKISNIKQNKQAQYRDYMEYQRELQRQREAAAEQERIRRNLQKMMAVVSSGVDNVIKTLETLNGVRTSNGGPVETSPFDMFWDTVGSLSNLPGDLWDVGGQIWDTVTDMPSEIWDAVTSQFTVEQSDGSGHMFVYEDTKYVDTEHFSGTLNNYAGDLSYTNDFRFNLFNTADKEAFKGFYLYSSVNYSAFSTTISGDLETPVAHDVPVNTDIDIVSGSGTNKIYVDLKEKSIDAQTEAMLSLFKGEISTNSFEFLGAQINISTDAYVGGVGYGGVLKYDSDIDGNTLGLKGKLLLGVGAGLSIDIIW